MTHCLKATFKVAFFICSIFLSILSSDSNKNLSIKALWIVRTSMTSQEDIDNALEFAKKSNFNHLFIQVRGRGDSYYKSQVVPKTEWISRDNFDPLDYAIKKGQKIGLKVHAWINVYFVWSSQQLPKAGNHILYLHPEWMDQSFFSVTDLYSDNPLLRNEYGNQQFLSPAHPSVRNHLLRVFEEILSNYNIDGLHLDYIRYNDTDFGYNPVARMGFKKKYGIDPIKLYRSSNTGLPTLDNEERRQYLWQQWNQYRRDAVTELVRLCNSLILDIKPNCLLSVAVKPNPNSAKDRFFQEWDRWLVEGLVDYVVPMNYAPNLREFARNIDLVYESIPTKYWSGIIMGISIFNQNALNARDKIKYSRITGFPGISIFSYDSHKDDPEFFTPIVEEMSQ